MHQNYLVFFHKSIKGKGLNIIILCRYTRVIYAILYSLFNENNPNLIIQQGPPFKMLRVIFIDVLTIVVL